jgi:hypothetical protein
LRPRTTTLRASLAVIERQCDRGSGDWWSTSDAGVVTVLATGLVRAIAAGTATITATSEGRSGTAIITVAQ